MPTGLGQATGMSDILPSLATLLRPEFIEPNLAAISQKEVLVRMAELADRTGHVKRVDDLLTPARPWAVQ